MDVVQLVADRHDIGALGGHFGAGGDDVGVGCLVALHGAAVGTEGGFQGRQCALLTGTERRAEVLQTGDGFFQLRRSAGFGFCVGTIGIAAHFVASLLELILGLGHGQKLREAFRAIRRLLHTGLQRIDLRVGDIGLGAHDVARSVAIAVGLAHFVQGLAVGGNDGFLVIEQLEVFRALEAIQQLLLLSGEGIEAGLYVLRHGFVAIGQHVLQAHDAQLGQRGVELGDIAHPIATVDQAAEAGPARERQD